MDIIITIVICLVFSALFSGLEIAFVSSNKLRFELDKRNSRITSRIIEYFFAHRDNYIATMLVGNNIVLVIYGAKMATLLSPYIQRFITSDFVVMIIQTVIATVIVLITGEFLPKTIFKSNPNLWLKIFSPLMLIFYWGLYPITIFASSISKGILRLLHQYDEQNIVPTLNKIDLDHLVNESIENTTEGEKIENDVRIFQNALDFSSVKLRDCSVPRTEIIALPEEGTTLEDIKDSFINTGYSKIPIYRETIDNIVGYIHAVDLFGQPADWHTCIRTIPIVPETMAANKLMDTFMQQKKSIAVVIDEFGGTSGIVTLEDIMEEIFGEIEDEHDNREYTAERVGEGEYTISGRMEISTLNTLFPEIGIEEDDAYVTLAGYILYHYNHIPKFNDTIEIPPYTFRIMKAHKNRIELVGLTITKAQK